MSYLHIITRQSIHVVLDKDTSFKHTMFKRSGNVLHLHTQAKHSDILPSLVLSSICYLKILEDSGRLLSSQ
jgi:hypothetical protein